MSIALQEPAILPVIIQFGETWARTLTITRDGSPVDVTHYTFILNIVLTDETLKTVTVTKSDPTQGVISWNLSAVDSVKIPVGNYMWGLIVTDTGGAVRNYIAGPFGVK